MKIKFKEPKFLTSHGWFVECIAGGKTYLQTNGTTGLDCTNGWFDTKEQALAAIKKITKNPPKKPPKKLFISNTVKNMLIDIGMNGSAVTLSNGHIEVLKNTFGTRADKELISSDLIDGKIKIGRLIRAISPDLEDHIIEKYVSNFKMKYTLSTDDVMVSDDVSDVYDISECGGSCMAGYGEYMEIYEDMKSSVVYITDDCGDLRARALIHNIIDSDGNEHTAMDRIFFDVEKDKLILQKWRREQKGMVRISQFKSNPIRGKHPIEDYYEDGVPYIDNLSKCVKIDDEYYLATSSDSNNNWNYVDTLQETGGGSRDGVISQYNMDMVWATDTERNIPEEDAYYCDSNEEYYESNDMLVIIGERYHHQEDDDIAFDEHEEEWAMLEDLKYNEGTGEYTSDPDVWQCDESGNYYHMEDMVTTDDEYTVHIDHASYIDDLDIYVYHTDDYFEHDDGKWYSYEEKEDEDE